MLRLCIAETLGSVCFHGKWFLEKRIPEKSSGSFLFILLYLYYNFVGKFSCHTREFVYFPPYFFGDCYSSLHRPRILILNIKIIILKFLYPLRRSVSCHKGGYHWLFAVFISSFIMLS